MYIAMNRFKILKEKQEEFVSIWKNRETHLNNVNGFIKFNLIKGIEEESYVVYASHSTWKSELEFRDWTKSEHFRNAHKNAGNNRHLYVDHPVFEGFEVIL